MNIILIALNIPCIIIVIIVVIVFLTIVIIVLLIIILLLLLLLPLSEFIVIVVVHFLLYFLLFNFFFNLFLRYIQIDGLFIVVKFQLIILWLSLIYSQITILLHDLQVRQIVFLIVLDTVWINLFNAAEICIAFLKKCKIYLDKFSKYRIDHFAFKFYQLID